MTSCGGWGVDKDDLPITLDEILSCLEGTDLFAAAHKCLLFDTEISWCGKVYSGGQVFHDRERLRGFSEHVPPADGG